MAEIRTEHAAGGVPRTAWQTPHLCMNTDLRPRSAFGWGWLRAGADDSTKRKGRPRFGNDGQAPYARAVAHNIPRIGPAIDARLVGLEPSRVGLARDKIGLAGECRDPERVNDISGPELDATGSPTGTWISFAVWKLREGSIRSGSELPTTTDGRSRRVVSAASGAAPENAPENTDSPNRRSEQNQRETPTPMKIQRDAARRTHDFTES